MLLNIHLMLICIFFLLFASCQQKKQDKPHINPYQYKHQLIEANRILSVSEDVQIDDYIARKGWKMQKTQTGLRYWIYKKGTGQQVQMMDIVRLRYRVELINGYVCYDHKENEFEEIQIGRSTAPPGLEQGLLMMREGDRAKLILPSHLGYGLLGDLDRIPAKAILIYDVEVLQVKPGF